MNLTDADKERIEKRVDQIFDGDNELVLPIIALPDPPTPQERILATTLNLSIEESFDLLNALKEQLQKRLKVEIEIQAQRTLEQQNQMDRLYGLNNRLNQ